MNGFSDEVKEAVRAYGATEWQVLRGVELPLAKTSLFARINQTILLCLSRFVIASLIGAQRLGGAVIAAICSKGAKVAGWLCDFAVNGD